MAEMSNFLENALINATLRATTYTSPAAVYVSLHTADPGDDGSGAEVSGGSYAREAATFDAPSGGVTQNSAAIEFNQATGTWGTITHFGLWDALTTGNLLYHSAFDVSKTIETGDILKIDTGSLTVTLD
jgi:hypothetical protein